VFAASWRSVGGREILAKMAVLRFAEPLKRRRHIALRSEHSR
jgi:hypothetical protein